jgi:hypothetical protein
MPDHRTAKDFQVLPPRPTPKADAMSAAIRYLEPEMRAKGRAIDWSLFNQSLMSGGFEALAGTDQEAIEKTVAKFEENLPARIEPEI